MSITKLVQEIDRVENFLNGSGLTILQLKQMVALGAKVTIPNPETQASPRKEQNQRLANVDEVLRSWADSNLKPQEIAAAVGLNPKSHGDVKKVRQAMANNPLIGFTPGSRPVYQKRLAGPAE